MLFEWDESKATSNLQKHGISFFEATTVFDSFLSYTTFDEEHSLAEDQFITIGFNITGKLLVVAHTDRYEDIVRIISARPATQRERKDFEDGTHPQ